jgi:pimeloyl-ACP methyl ester carboxylesterase
MSNRDCVLGPIAPTFSGRRPSARLNRGHALVAVALAGCLAVVGCSGGDHDSRSVLKPAKSRGARTGSPPAAPGPGLGRPSACRPSFTCAVLEVPLDRADTGLGTLALRVAVESEVSAGRGLLLVLAGGPGQAGVPLVKRLVDSLRGGVVHAYRIVVLDQRGTGATALRCPDLQRAMGFSDLTPPSAAAVGSCARSIGNDRELYSTDDVLADLDQLRGALGAGKMTLYGTSYGTFVAEQYAIAHPGRTRALVLDSVVPHTGVDPLAVDLMKAVRRVLLDACASTRCVGDPVEDAAAVVAREHDGADLLDLATMISVVEPGFGPLLEALHAAARGSTGQLEALLRGYRNGFQGPAEELSQGLHASALCSDWRFPWGTSAAPLAGREAAVDTAVGALAPADLAPFDADTARGNGFLRQCLPWPPVPDAPLVRDGDLPDVPTLLLAGTHDLSTPLEWAQREARHAPGGHLVVVPGAGHGVARQGGKGLTALREFLLR